MQIRKGDKVKKIIYLLLLLVFIIFAVLNYRNMNRSLKDNKEVNEGNYFYEEEVQRKLNDPITDYYTFEELNNQEYILSSDNNKSTQDETNPHSSDNTIVTNSDKLDNYVDHQEANEVIDNTIDNVEKEIVEENDNGNQNLLDDSVDTNSIDYHIHRGRIDCFSADDCMNKSIPIQLKYKKSISNVNYLEVIAKSDKTLGYFIEYVFVEYTYPSLDKCNEIGTSIKATLSDRVIGFECNPNGLLKIKTDY